MSEWVLIIGICDQTSIAGTKILVQREHTCTCNEPTDNQLIAWTCGNSSELRQKSTFTFHHEKICNWKRLQQTNINPLREVTKVLSYLILHVIIHTSTTWQNPHQLLSHFLTTPLGRLIPTPVTSRPKDTATGRSYNRTTVEDVIIIIIIILD